MVDSRLTPAAWRAIAAIALFIGVVLVGKLAWDRYDDSYAVARRDDGQAVTQIVRATFSRASALKVGALSGTVQSVATDTRGMGMLTSDRVMKAPFSVDYFVDVSRLSDSDYRWDAATRTLALDAPDITVDRPNVDESATTLSETRGLIVTRGAAETLAKRNSVAAQASAQTEANKPDGSTPPARTLAPRSGISSAARSPPPAWAMFALWSLSPMNAAAPASVGTRASRSRKSWATSSDPTFRIAAVTISG